MPCTRRRGGRARIRLAEPRPLVGCDHAAIRDHAASRRRHPHRGDRDAATGPREPDAKAALTGSVSALLAETLPEIKLPADATAQETTAIITEALGPAILTLSTCFSYAFVHLAEVHDEGNTDTSTADVLRSLSLQFARRDDA